MKKWMFLFICATIFLTNLWAQMPSLRKDGVVEIEKDGVKITMVPYARNIVKVTLQPKDYSKNELISDAVILKPMATSVKIKSDRQADYIATWGSIQLVAKGDTFFFGKKRNAVIVKPLVNKDTYGFQFLLTDDEKIFGSGERALPLDRRGYRLNLNNNPWYGYGMGADNLNYSVPFITSSNNYALFFDNPSKGFIDIGKSNPDILEYGAQSGELNFYLITGTSYPDILTSYFSLTGKQPLPPRWAMGNFLSRFGYVSETEIKGIMQKMKEASIPYDAVIFDLFWFGDSIKSTMGNLEWVNKKAWPNPKKMITDFTNDGTKTILITEPFVLKTSLNYDTSKKFHAVDSAGKPYILQDFYFGKGGLIDIFRKDSKNWFWKKYKQQMDNGVEAWWGDLGEPEKHPSDLYHNLKDLGFERLFKADEVHNLYGHYWTKMLFEKYAAEYPAKRLFSLNRSGFAGTQRYAIYPWTGDVSRSWSGLQAQMPVLLGMSMSGVPYVHSDAGGFAGTEKEPDLYVRWLQFAAFTPIFRPHGTELTAIDTASKSYPSEPALFDEPYLSLARRVVQDRYKMMPYNYTLAYEQATAGKPLMSPLYYYFAQDTNTYRMQNEYMWGENILVSPVVEKNTLTKNTYLPTGKWYRLNNHEKLEGGREITDTVSLSNIPVFVKEGSFITTNNVDIKNTSFYSTDNITVTYFPSANFSENVLYDDDGNTNNAIDKKLFELLTFQTDGLMKETGITIRSNGGKFLGKPQKREITLSIPGLERKPQYVSINNVQVTDSEVAKTRFTWNEERKLLSIHFTFAGDTMMIKFMQ